MPAGEKIEEIDRVIRTEVQKYRSSEEQKCRGLWTTDCGLRT